MTRRTKPTGIIAVLGATGRQGSSLVRAILASPDCEFTVRAITRDRKTEKAQALIAQGVEVVEADLNVVETLASAFEGVYGVFAITDFWQSCGMSGAIEEAQASNIAVAAKATGVQHVVWSSLEDTSALIPADDATMPILQEKYRVPHFDAKGRANAFFAGVPTTILNTSFFYGNLDEFYLAPAKQADGTYLWQLPMEDAKLACMDSADIGGVALSIFELGDHYIGSTVGIAGDALTIAEMAEILSRVFEIEVRYEAISAQAYRDTKRFAADELAAMFEADARLEHTMLSNRDIALTKALNSGTKTFEVWLQQPEIDARMRKHLGLGAKVRETPREIVEVVDEEAREPVASAAN
jgi:uncharacterized protein YbjT (DUF2867 family)